MRKTIPFFISAIAATVLFCSCGSINTLIQSNNPGPAYDKAMEFMQKKKWVRASTLLEGVASQYIGTPREDSLTFYDATCKFNNHDYATAAEIFDAFRHKFGRSPFIEKAEAMLATSYYHMSPPPERDQARTSQAIIAITEFMSRYPDSKYIPEFKQMNEELSDRLRDQSYLNAYTYYKIGRYESAIIALKNALRQYPDNKHREEMMYLVAEASYRFADSSVPSKQIDRFQAMRDSYLSFKAEFPDSEHMKELDKLDQHARDFLARSKSAATDTATAAPDTAPAPDNTVNNNSNI